MSIYVAGFLLSNEQVGHLCVKGYGISEAVVKYTEPIGAASQHFYGYRAYNPTGLVPMYRKNSSLTEEDIEGFILTCRVAFVKQGLKEPVLSLDHKTLAFADFWFPPFLRELDEFRGVRYVQYRLPRQLGCPHMFINDINLAHITSKAAETRRLMPFRWTGQTGDGGDQFIVQPPPLPAEFIHTEPSSSARLNSSARYERQNSNRAI
ncbi:uncharacterized protein BXZ73DRAFT_109028 [Epithele typhae]|uniref:uncharacterized protein n=1 Tax=Epithele typhae TaxID=378194 RepID=UPI002008CB2E|nr:uncharacterized protein BXZ73DRAFT_109028 [Epithele typhae]KAH9910418.1 hypothetical protein BXZ73DRAFT_109028 [Epithele typhae]